MGLSVVRPLMWWTLMRPRAGMAWACGSDASCPEPAGGGNGWWLGMGNCRCVS